MSNTVNRAIGERLCDTQIYIFSASSVLFVIHAELRKSFTIIFINVTLYL